ncbi:MAG TPA: flagellar biosynthesis anti-sigma factor FlgM [Clostridia bacterium]|jgi:negative regulator of flagellin synthesis FlgM|nr:flagellar biosynthesis anti-sigma factor FlgM [Clostridia bacterium]
MVIRGIGKGYISKVYGHRPVKEPDLKPNEAEQGGDSVEISKAAKEMQKLVQNTLALDDVRLEKVEDLKNKIDTGQYHVPAKKLADAILKYTGWSRAGDVKNE